MSLSAATLALTVSFLTVDTDIDKRGKITQRERIAYTSIVIPYDSMTACENGKSEWDLAVGAYQLSKRPARVIMAVCNDSRMGTVQ